MIMASTGCIWEDYKNDRRAEQAQGINQTWMANPGLDEQIYLSDVLMILFSWLMNYLKTKNQRKRAQRIVQSRAMHILFYWNILSIQKR